MTDHRNIDWNIRQLQAAMSVGIETNPEFDELDVDEGVSYDDGTYHSETIVTIEGAKYKVTIQRV